jgi:hypothetical protein
MFMRQWHAENRHLAVSAQLMVIVIEGTGQAFVRFPPAVWIHAKAVQHVNGLQLRTVAMSSLGSGAVSTFTIAMEVLTCLSLWCQEHVIF